MFACAARKTLVDIVGTGRKPMYIVITTRKIEDAYRLYQKLYGFFDKFVSGRHVDGATWWKISLGLRLTILVSVSNLYTVTLSFVDVRGLFL